LDVSGDFDSKDFESVEAAPAIKKDHSSMLFMSLFGGLHAGPSSTTFLLIALLYKQIDYAKRPQFTERAELLEFLKKSPPNLAEKFGFFN
jgi:hypothetical protein